MEWTRCSSFRVELAALGISVAEGVFAGVSLD
jgi:hypothetical protein